ncbi:hypothetical protein HCN44_008212 [Aphidius gifuensis]|uniref:Structural maintenance of chromosomes protein n=1 Tax=Aphidius gifuensis TaxID=684658 RepID=A0A835CPV5_APHGI|nr:hypothetical protein HCN44_008212 [Aphidius gifuensis]
MYVKSMVLDGFKSYGKRIEINGFDKEFNAITGLNGSGKSNVLDAICFVLGITTLGQVRATSLQELVYKSGHAGIKKATVSITFDNSNKDGSPIGYEHYNEITVTRQIVIDGKNKYLINGTNVPNKRVHDMFCSVQLNVNNPHFLIMQGRITKVLNMKPLEILSMIEEAAGTRLYQEKKDEAMKTIAKKNNRLKEIEAILNEEIGPKLVKLKDERAQFVEFQRVERELEHCRKIVVAYRYVTALQSSEDAKNSVKLASDNVDSKKKLITDGQEEIKLIEVKISDLSKLLDKEKGDVLDELERKLKELEKNHSKLVAESNSNMENIKTEEKNIIQLKKNLTDDKTAYDDKKNELNNVGGLFEKLRKKNEEDAASVIAAQERLQKITAGLLETDTGENATLEQQLMNAKRNATTADTEVKQCEMGLKFSKEQLSLKQKETKTNDTDYQRDNKDLELKEKQLKTLTNELKKLNYEDGSLEILKDEKRNLINEIDNLKENIDQFTSRYPQLRFNYQDPSPNFNRDSVKGLVCTLLRLKDKKTAYALDVAAGNRLYNVIVDTEKTSKALLQNGQLQQRVTIIPLNKISGSSIDERTIQYAEKLVGKDNVQSALSLIDYPANLKPAMSWIFGQVFVCKDMNVAKKIAFNDKIMKKCVTLEGDSCDPSGTLSGGAPSKTGSILLKMDDYNSMIEELKIKEKQLQQINDKIKNLNNIADHYGGLKQQLGLRTHEVNLLRQRLEQTSYHKLREEVEQHKQKIIQLTEQMAAAKLLAIESNKKANQIEEQLKDSTNIREKQLKDAENQLKLCQKKSEKSREAWQKHEQDSETLNLEIKDLENSIKIGQEQLQKAEEKLNNLNEKSVNFNELLEQSKLNVTEYTDKIKNQKTTIQQQNKEIHKLTNKIDDITKQTREFELEIKKLNHEINMIKTNAAECKQKVTDLLNKYDWIEQDKQYFGEPGGVYDFTVNEPAKIAQKMTQLETKRDKLSRNVNTRAMNLLSKEEERYQETIKKRAIVENDKKKIIETVSRLEEQKKETLLKAWEQVNRDFGSIFSSLLPGASAKLQPTESQNVLDGLEVKVGFSGVWKESLGELSGGQRSLVALSLVLAMLLFKPAPLYILDEVDAALDLSHTQNIGTMLKRHFKRSQFIIVSLKDGMFNNANVLFTTKFVDGMSTITRGEKKKTTADK